MIRVGIDLRRFVKHLKDLREVPLARDLPAVSGKPLLASLFCDLVYSVGVWLGGVMLPELCISVRLFSVFFLKAERSSVRLYRKHRAGGEINANTYYILFVDFCVCNDAGKYVIKDLKVIVRILKREIGRKLFAARAKVSVHHPVRVFHRPRGKLGSVRDTDEQRPSRQSPEIKSYSVFFRHKFTSHIFRTTKMTKEAREAFRRLI